MWFFRRRQDDGICEHIGGIASKYEGCSDSGEDAVRFIREECQHGEETLALETLFDWLYDVEIEPTEEEKRIMRDLGERLQVRRIFFWPEPPDDAFLRQQQ